jgi:hypothetical protein
MSPIETARTGSKAFPLSRLRAPPYCRGDYTPAGPAWAICHDRDRPVAMRTVDILVTRQRLADRPALLRSQSVDARNLASIPKGSCRMPTDRRSHARRD